MASIRKTTTERQEQQGSGTRALTKRPLPFLGLFMAAPLGLLTAWAMHVYLRGLDWTWTFGKWRPIDIHLAGSEPAWAATLILITLAAVGLSVWAWHAAEQRKRPLRVMLTGSVGAIALNFALAVGVGPSRWWSFFQLLAFWLIGAVWVMPRLDVARRDSRQEEPKEDGLTEKLGLTGYGFAKAKQFFLGDKLVRTDIPVTHAPGGTIAPLQDAVPAIESLADSSGLGGPAGMTTVRPGTGASQSEISIIHEDILEGGVAYELPLALQRGVEMTVEEPEVIGRYLDLEPATEETRTTQGVIGVTGAGKTEYMRVRVTGLSTRKWVARILYFDQVKGMQSAAPILGALGVCVLSNDKAPHKAGIKALKKIIEYRADMLGRLGYDSWEPGIIDENGDPVPKLVAWFEEADALIDGLEADMKFIASKTRSTGVVVVWSLQRADGESMPTSVRANITSWSVFGITPADDYAAGFALGDDVVKAGAQPFWGDTKPGYYYRTERGVPAKRWPVVRRVFQADRATYAAITDEHGPRMMPVDRGTIAATAGWYEQAIAERQELARTMKARVTAPMTASPTGGAKATVTATAGRPAFTATAPTGAEGESMADRAAIEQEIDDDIAEMRASTEVPSNPEMAEGMPPIDVDSEIPPPGPDDEISWEDIGGKPEARDRKEALDAVIRTLVVLSQDPTLRDPADPTVTLFQVDTIVKRYPFRSRPWFSTALAELAYGDEPLPSELGLTMTADDDDDGHYRLHRVAPTRPETAPEIDGA